MPRRSTLRLTKRIVERLKADGKDAIFWDRDLAGFGVRVHTTGRKLYIVQSRGPAGLKRVTLGRVGTKTVDERRRDAAVVIDRIKRGEDPVPSEPAPEPTVADLAERCLKNYVAVRCKPRTAKNYRLAIQHHILPALGTKALKDVAPEDVTALHHNLRNTPAAANQAIWVLSKMFNLAENWEMVPPGRKPGRHVRQYRETSRERFLTPEEFRRLGAALKRFEAEGSMMPSAIAAVRLLMLTGCRSGRDPFPEMGRCRPARRGCCGCATPKTGPRMVLLTGPVLKVLDGIERAEGVPWVLLGAKAGSRLGLPLLALAADQEGDRGFTTCGSTTCVIATPPGLSRSARACRRSAGCSAMSGSAPPRNTPTWVRDAEKAAAARTGDSIGAHIMPGRAEAA